MRTCPTSERWNTALCPASGTSSAAAPGVGTVLRAAAALAGARPRGLRSADAPGHELRVEIDMEALIVARRARGGHLIDLVAQTAAPLLVGLGEAMVGADDGTTALVGAPGSGADAPRRPAATLMRGAVAARPTVGGGAVTVRHLAPLTVRIAAGLATAEQASTLLAALRSGLERGPG